MLDGTAGVLTVFYNTKCPVCDAGIDFQRNRLVKTARAGAIRFEDIGQIPDALAGYGAGVEDVRRRLHGLDGRGLHVGIDCAVEIWRRTPGDGWLARVVGGSRLLKPLAAVIYDRFADVVYAWNRRRGHW